jgi:hypothetical protein
MSKGPYLEPISGYYLFRQVSNQHRRRQRGGTRTRPLKMGHGPLVVMYPESLLSKLSAYADKIGEGKHLPCKVDGGTVSPIGVG